MKKKKTILSNYDPKATLNRDEEVELYALARSGDERAMRRLLESWNGMFVTMATGLLGYAKNHPTMEQEDILQEMRLLALSIVNADKWDPAGGMRLSTFINGGIRLRIHEIINKQDQVGTFKNAYQAKHEDYGKHTRADSVYLSESTRPDVNTRYQDVIADDTSSRMSSEATVKMMEQVESLLGDMTEREQDVIRHAFGLDNQLMLTVNEIDAQYDWEPGTAKRIRDNVIWKLRKRHATNP